ncbi:MAG: oxidoreductase, partial [Saprospiraceae bacterium]|nr:oxidoreductase [Saprospiraceae bacterium]
IHSHDRAAGFMELERARVRWFLSINYDCLPEEIKEKGLRTYRSVKIEGEEFEFSGGFTELHTRSYEHILSGEGFGLEENRKSIQIVHDIRQAVPVGLVGDYHPLAGLPLADHPFS